MKLSKVKMVKDGNTIVLRGMVHVAPEVLYQRIQKELDVYVSQGFVIFAEGIKNYEPNVKDNNKNIEYASSFFDGVFKLYPDVASFLGVVEQKKNIKYPDNVVSPDLEYSELLQLFGKKEVNCESLALLFDWLGKDSNNLFREIIYQEIKIMVMSNSPKFVRKVGSIFRVLKTLIKYRDTVHELERFDKSSVGLKSTLSVLDSIIVGYRDKLAVDSINNYKESNKIYVLYGQGHVKGIVKGLKEYGWRVVSHSHLKVRAI